MDCPFCDYEGPPPVLRREGLPAALGEVLVFAPKFAGTDGHVLVVPSRHLEDFRDDPELAAAVFRVAAEWARDHADGGCALLCRAGSDVGQTVPHMHVHVLPA